MALPCNIFDLSRVEILADCGIYGLHAARARPTEAREGCGRLSESVPGSLHGGGVALTLAGHEAEAVFSRVSARWGPGTAVWSSEYDLKMKWVQERGRGTMCYISWVYKALNNMSPSYLKELIVPYQPTRALCSQHSGLLVVPKVSKSRVGARAFSYQAPLLWNHLPVSIREADTIYTFKSRLETFLFDKAYS